jgi:predicted regulator of Ras-like GTPase activity (Roadblock/LC7/MglB family)
MLAGMDAAQAIGDLTEISPQVQHVVALAADGSVLGSNLPDERAAQRLADGAGRLVEAAEAMRPGIQQLEAATVSGSVFVVRDAERTIVATTTPEPTVGLVFYDLKTCLRSIDEPSIHQPPEPAPKRKVAAKRAPKEDGDAAA